MDDRALLERYVSEGSQHAFGELVQRHLRLVYHAALRRAGGDPHAAAEISQTVFVLLARKARSLVYHQALTGWLHSAAVYAARDRARSEYRRRLREQTAFAMNAERDDAGSRADWLQLRPVIDEALDDLNASERAAVILRFFENRRYAEVAAELRTSENSARMRVDRALLKLRSALAKRGVTSTAAALGAALTVPASAEIPAGLAPQIVSAAVSGAATAGATSALFFFTTMMTSKTAGISAALIALAAGGIALHQHRQLAEARASAADWHARADRDHKLVADLEWRLAAAHEHNAKTGEPPLAAAAASSPNAQNPLAAPAHPITRDLVEARLKKAKDLAVGGHYAEALVEYLWCYDTGTRQVEGFFLQRYSSLLGEIAQLGKSYPPALDALRHRRDAAKERLLASATDLEAGKDFSQINRVLNEDDQTTALFDALGEDDPRRGHIIEPNMRRLVEAKRYRESAKAFTYDATCSIWDQMTQAARSPAQPEAARAKAVSNVVEFVTTQIEVQAGAGHEVEASDLIERVLIFNNAPETVEKIKQHLDRAGRPDLFRS